MGIVAVGTGPRGEDLEQLRAAARRIRQDVNSAEKGSPFVGDPAPARDPADLNRGMHLA